MHAIYVLGTVIGFGLLALVIIILVVWVLLVRAFAFVNDKEYETPKFLSSLGNENISWDIICGAAFFTFALVVLTWPFTLSVGAITAVVWGLLLLIRFIFRTQKMFAVIGKHTHDHPKTVKKTKVEIDPLAIHK